MRTELRQTTLAGFLAFTLAITYGCASKPTTTQAPGVTKTKIAITSQEDLTEKQAMALIENGQIAEAALIYNKIADTKSSPERERLKFHAVRLMINSGNGPQASRILQDMDIHPGEEYYAQAMILQAQILITDRNATEALNLLNQIEAEIPEPLLAEFLKTRISGLKLEKDYLQAGLQHIMLQNLLKEDSEKAANERAILENFQLLPAKELKSIIDQTTSSVTRGWLELALLTVSTKDVLRLSGLIQNWRLKYTTHPASEQLLESLAPPVDTTPPDLSHIAILLPMEGPFARAADAIRDGFLAAYYQESNKQAKPIVSIYNTGGSDNIGEIYQKALNNGATVVVGPLDKNNISKLIESTSLSVPTLALNHLENEEIFTENLFQFGLSPEDEAAQIARRAWYDGHNEAAIIVPEGSWGERVAKAFRQNWEALGGAVMAESFYPAKKNDFSSSITRLLNIDQSTERKKSLSGLLGARLHFEPRRRHDIDFIFMGSFPRQARLIPPQLKFFNAGDLPVYTTSHSFSGKINRSADRDMNGVIIGDMPWTLVGNIASPVRATVYRTFGRDVEKFSRLYALGVDSYNILYYLNWLRSNTNARLNGATGIIHMGLNNRLERDLTWARFSRGRPQVLALTPTL